MRYTYVRQHDTTDCAAACLAMVCLHYKKEITITRLRDMMGTDLKGTNLTGMEKAAQELGFSTAAVRVDRENFLSEFTTPCIAQVITDEGLAHDARMGVTEVVRGADLLSSTARQLYLYRLLGLPAPKFAHCPLLLASDGRRLSKRDGDQSLENLRARYTAEDIVGRLAYAYGLQEEPAPRTPESLIKDFSWDKVPKKDICLPEGLF